MTTVMKKRCIAEVPKYRTTKEEESCEHEEQMEGSPDFCLDTYREHLSRRQIIINGVIDKDMVEKVTLQIAKFNEIDDQRQETEKDFDRMHYPIYLKIDSHGGYISYGLGIVSQIVQSRTPVIGVATGDCSSMATIILAVCHARYSSMFSTIMIHSLAGGCFGKLWDKIDDTEESKRLQKVLDGILTSKTIITQKQLDAVHLQRKDWYLDAKEAEALGLIDGVYTEGLRLLPIRKRMKEKAL